MIGAFPMARRRELFGELQPLVVDFAEHPWSWAAELGKAYDIEGPALELGSVVVDGSLVAGSRG